MQKKVLTGSIGAIGLGLTILAFFAQQLGIGHSSHWGSGRIIIAGMGIFLIVVALLIVSWHFLLRVLAKSKKQCNQLLHAFLKLHAVDRLLQMFRARLNSWKSAWDHWLPVRWFEAHARPPLDRVLSRIRNSRLVRFFSDSQDHAAGLAAGILGIGIVLLYVWFVSVGRWNDWPKTTSYYQALADGFWHGQVSLLTKPDPALLALDNPYDLINRQHVTYVWDAVLYNGKFYLYWGPIPALIVAAARLFYHSEIDDQILVFAFVLGTFLFSGLLILRLRRRLFPRLKWPYVIPGILMAGLANPMTWLLNRPTVYEAAISGGQFFLMAGFYLVFIALERPRPSSRKLLAASVCLAMAVATRASLALAAVFIILAATWWIIRHYGFVRRSVLMLAALGVPFTGGIAGMGWYNNIRFGSWLEFGIRYMLTGMDLHSNTFSLSNLLINLHNYLLNPYRILSSFPFFKPNYGGHFIFFPIHAPTNYYSEQVSGLIPTEPYILLAVLPVLFLLGLAWNVVRRTNGQKKIIVQNGDGYFQWTAITLSGAFLLAFAPILLFIAGTMRYLGDVVPLLVLLSTVGFWLGAQFLEYKPALHGWFVVLVVVLMLFSVGVSVLLAVTGYEARFEHLNPVLFEQISKFFNR
jgi:hypothetical protein